MDNISIAAEEYLSKELNRAYRNLDRAQSKYVCNADEIDNLRRKIEIFSYLLKKI